MKNIIKKKKNIDIMAEVRKNKNYAKYANEADIKIRIAEEVYKARTKKGLSQQELAKIIGTTQKVLSNIENADVNVGTVLLHKISIALGFTANNFVRIYKCPVMDSALAGV